MPSTRQEILCHVCKQGEVPLVKPFLHCGNCRRKWHTCCHDPLTDITKEENSANFVCKRCRTRCSRRSPSKPSSITHVARTTASKMNDISNVLSASTVSTQPRADNSVEVPWNEMCIKYCSVNSCEAALFSVDFGAKYRAEDEFMEKFLTSKQAPFTQPVDKLNLHDTPCKEKKRKIQQKAWHLQRPSLSGISKSPIQSLQRNSMRLLTLPTSRSIKQQSISGRSLANVSNPKWKAIEKPLNYFMAKSAGPAPCIASPEVSTDGCPDFAPPVPNTTRENPLSSLRAKHTETESTNIVKKKPVVMIYLKSQPRIPSRLDQLSDSSVLSASKSKELKPTIISEREIEQSFPSGSEFKKKVTRSDSGRRPGLGLDGASIEDQATAEILSRPVSPLFDNIPRPPRVVSEFVQLENSIANFNIEPSCLTEKVIIASQDWVAMDPTKVWPRKVSEQQRFDQIQEIKKRPSKKDTFGIILPFHKKEERWEQGWETHQCRKYSAEHTASWKKIGGFYGRLYGTKNPHGSRPAADTNGKLYWTDPPKEMFMDNKELQRSSKTIRPAKIRKI